MAEKNMSMITVLRPYWRFEYWYTHAIDQFGWFPIPFMPVNPNIPANGNPPEFDPYAFDRAARDGVDNYSPLLAAMMPMPQIGSDVMVWIPQIPCQADANYCYVYVPVWRMRTPRDTRTYRTQGNFLRESLGATDNGQARYILPAASQAVLLGRQEFNSDFGLLTPPASLQPSSVLRDGLILPAYDQNVVDQPPVAPAAIVPNPSYLEYQQGIAGETFTHNTSPFYRQYWMKVMGNELGFWVYKASYPQPASTQLGFVNWDFQYDIPTGYCDPTAEEAFFSSIYGVGCAPADPQVGPLGMNRNSGIYVMTGITSG